MPLPSMRSGNLKKTDSASKAPQPENSPTRPAERVGEGDNNGFFVAVPVEEVVGALMEARASLSGASWRNGELAVKFP